jgi:hypothetical protein
MKTLSDLLLDFEDGLKKFVVENANQIRFTQPQYEIDKIDDNHYDFTVSITGMGTQHFELNVVSDEFMVKGKLIDTTSKFPLKLVAELVNGVIMSCFAESAMIKLPPPKGYPKLE